MRARVALAVLALGCGGDKSAPRQEIGATAPAPEGPARPDEPEPSEPAAPADFPEGTRSLELTKTVAVRLEPGDAAKRIGAIAVDTRVGWFRTQKARGCSKPWIEMKPRGWICGEFVKPSTRAPHGREVPFLERGEIVPGIYGKVTAPNSVMYVVEKPKKDDAKKKKGDKKNKPVTSPSEVDGTKDAPPGPKLVEGPPLVGSVTVRQYEEITVDNKTYWRVNQRDPEYVLRQAITQHKPSLYMGSRLGDDTGWQLPIAFVWPRVVSWGQAYTTYKPLGGGQVRPLPMRTPVALLETAADKAGKPIAYRIGEAEWIAAADVRLFTPLPPPPHLEPNERWIDVDLDNQILVAFEGEMPVYATMVSTGAKDTPTATGLYRMWLKESESDMKNLKSEDPYSVATVPWTQFFSSKDGLALHSAYWHDQFGTRRSHGCVNLAPRDARWLYFWSDPQVPPGWTSAAGVVEAPGSIVRVRSKDDPSPAPKEYAIKVEEARQHNAPLR